MKLRHYPRATCTPSTFSTSRTAGDDRLAESLRFSVEVDTLNAIQSADGRVVAAGFEKGDWMSSPAAPRAPASRPETFLRRVLLLAANGPLEDSAQEVLHRVSGVPPVHVEDLELDRMHGLRPNEESEPLPHLDLRHVEAAVTPVPDMVGTPLKRAAERVVHPKTRTAGLGRVGGRNRGLVPPVPCPCLDGGEAATVPVDRRKARPTQRSTYMKNRN